MTLLVVVIIWVLFVGWFLYIMGSLYFSRNQITADDAPAPADWPRVSVIIPARNEEDNIGRAVESLLNQTYPTDRYTVIVVDDHSEDRTAEIVATRQAAHPNLQLLEGRPLTDGWTGKSNACATGATRADGDWYCFMDADTYAEPELLRAAVGYALHHKADLLSFNPFQELVSFTERALLPGIFLAIASSMDFRKANDPDAPEAIANGQFLLFRRSAYEAIGGHDSVKDVVMEDLAFARVVKQAGKRLCWAFGDDIMRTRMYRNFDQIWHGFSKNMSDVMAHRSAFGSLVAAARSLLLAWVPLALPVVTAGFYRANPSTHHLVALVLAAAATANLCIFFWAAVRALRLPLPYLLCLPFGFTMHAALLLGNLWKKKTNQIEWKGRVIQ